MVDRGGLWENSKIQIMFLDRYFIPLSLIYMINHSNTVICASRCKFCALIHLPSLQLVLFTCLTSHRNLIRAEVESPRSVASLVLGGHIVPRVDVEPFYLYGSEFIQTRCQVLILFICD